MVFPWRSSLTSRAARNSRKNPKLTLDTCNVKSLEVSLNAWHGTAYLEWLEESPQQQADGIALPQQLDEAESSEQAEETEA